MTENTHQSLAQRLAEQFSRLDQVEAVALGGSQTSGAPTDTASDIDLYVYVNAPIPLQTRLEIVEQLGGAAEANMDLNLWDPGDEWFDARTGIEVDAMYWDPNWVKDFLARVIDGHQASLGYTTAHWHTIAHSQLLFDRQSWFADVQAWSRQPYPEPLRQNIINKNFPILRDLIPSYLHQIEKAVRRQDLVSINHRVAGFLASYFDIIFAHNRVLHPGEKRLLDHAARLCPHLPDGMHDQVTAMLNAAGSVDMRVVEEGKRLVEGVEGLIGT